MPRTVLLCLLAGFLIACNPSATSLKAIADSYTFSKGALSTVAKDKGVLANDSLPAAYP